MDTSWLVAFKRRELINKISLTLLLLMIYKIGIYVTVPGIDRNILEAFVGSTNALEIANLVSGGAMSQFSIFALGVMPYITASIIIQLLSYDVIPTLAEWKKQGEYGNRKTKKLTYKLTVVFALLQGVGISYGLNTLYPGLVVSESWGAILLIAFLLMIGSMVLVMFGEIITKKGIGNGLSVIIFGSIMMSMPSVFTMYYEGYIRTAGDMLWYEVIKAILILLFVVALLAFVVFVSKSERRIPIKNTVAKGNHLNTQAGNNTGSQNFLPFKLLSAGVIPVIFAVSFVMVPTTIAQYNTDKEWSMWITKYLGMNTWSGAILYVLIIMFFSYFYTFIQTNPEKLSNDLKNGGNFVPGIRPGSETEVYLTSVLKRITFAGSVILAVIAIIPVIASSVINLPASVQLGGVSVVILVSVGLDVMSRIGVYKNVMSYSRPFGKKEGKIK